MATIDSVKLPDNSTYDLTDNYSGYAKKVAGATTDDLASLTATGDLADSGKKLSDLVLKADVKDVLNSTSTTDPLSANQGRVLNENIEAIVNVYGAKNLIPFPYEGGMSYTFRGVTYTASDNGIISTANTATNDGWFVLATHIILVPGTYKIKGCPSGGSADTYRLTARVRRSGGTTNYYYDTGEGYTFTFNEGDFLNVTLNVGNGTDMDGLTFYPMLYDARVVDDTFVPYTPTNRELMSYKANGRVGAKNLNMYPYYETTKTSNGITFTDNGDGTIIVGGSSAQTATAQTFFAFSSWTTILEKGTYTMGGCPSGASSNSYRMTITYKNLNDQNVTVHIYSSEKTFTVERDTSVTYIAIQIENNVTIPAGGITFYPMIRIAEDTDETYQPYAKTNRELTDDKAERNDLSTIHVTGSTNTSGAQINAGTLFYLNGTLCKALANIAVNATFTLNTNFEVTSVGKELKDALDYSGNYMVQGIPYASSFGGIYVSLNLPIPQKLRNLYSYSVTDVSIGGGFSAIPLTLQSGDGIGTYYEAVNLTNTLNNYFTSPGAMFASLSDLVTANASITLTVVVS